ncbi:carboxypeptidase-like regulatory domain-containing protein [Aestuariivivens sediminis]|uniref:carboxypeptidase-like regulatory domain-containing protein n=1 Tax=Aestuariivivens sediminis TaxID=2913557 RepID=UPI001F565B61|nr:carboxypeptidase-like regulatory domain-containing protein [Aestuariivivens sediminis]
MKTFFLIAACFISAGSLAQNTGAISGRLLDADSANAPLMLAEVVVKETGATVRSNEKGAFTIEHLSEGTYTLLCSFVGYETKAVETKIVSGAVCEVTLALEPSTISLDELALTLASADSESASQTILER